LDNDHVHGFAPGTRQGVVCAGQDRKAVVKYQLVTEPTPEAVTAHPYAACSDLTLAVWKHLSFELAEATGRPGYHPAVLLKLYVYGDLDRVTSSRRLERETLRNVEGMWLLGRLSPDHKTIADFRKDNGKAIRKVCIRFVELCREIGLLAVASVAIFGSKSPHLLLGRSTIVIGTSTRDKMQRLKVLEKQMEASPDQQASLTDPARARWRPAAADPVWLATMPKLRWIPNIT
jgi:hypothetical protein